MRRTAWTLCVICWRGSVALAEKLLRSVRAALASSLSTRCTVPGVPPGGGVTFFCCARRKSPKKRRSTASRLSPATDIARELALDSADEASRFALAAVLVTSPTQPPSVRLTSAARRTHESNTKRRRRRVVASTALNGEPGVQRALNVVNARVLVPVPSGRRERSGSLLRESRVLFFAREPLAHARWLAVQRLFFGDFLLAQQKKVTRPPGRTPGTVHRVERRTAKASTTHSRQP
jgi:hypothetical protein